MITGQCAFTAPTSGPLGRQPQHVAMQMCNLREPAGGRPARGVRRVATGVGWMRLASNPMSAPDLMRSRIIRASRGVYMSSLLEQIEHGALDSKVPLADVLRKCLALGGQAGSSELRDWARQELEGYQQQESLPDYRLVPAIIALDGVTIDSIVSQQQISPSALPDFAQETIGEQAPVYWGIGQIEAMIKDAAGGTVKITLPRASDLVLYMNAKDTQYGQSITALYWALSASALNGLLDRVRTILVGLVAELRGSGTLGTNDVPSPAAANHAVQVVVHGGKRSPITVTTANASGEGNTVTTNPAPRPDTSLWARLRKPGATVVGLATVVAGIVAVAAWQGWNPFA